MRKQPNILLIITDQHRADHTGFGGNGVVRTPNLDALAARGAVFERAFVANPICMPNRSSILTGRVPSVHGTRYNGIALDPRAVTFPRLLREAGYHTATFGKCHFQNMGVGFDLFSKDDGSPRIRDARDDGLAHGWDQFEDMTRHAVEAVTMPDDFYGFSEVDLVIGHSDHCGGHYAHWAADKGGDLSKLQGRKNALPHEPVSHQAWRTALPVELYPTTYVTERAVQFLDRQTAAAVKEDNNPFFAIVSYPDPHHPFTPPGDYFDLYDPADMSLPATFDDPHEGGAPHYQRNLAARGGERKLPIIAPFAPTEAEFREMAAREFGMIALIDDGIGEILQALARRGLDEDTIVLFTSDHGDMFGDHGMMLKGAMHYEGCIRVPLVAAGAGIVSGPRPGMVCSLDLARTILELAGIPPFHGMQGASLGPMLGDRSATVRDEVLIEEDQIHDILRVGQPLRMRSLITDQGRITVYAGGGHGELFDWREDPEERRNLFADPAAARFRGEMMERLSRAMMQHADTSPQPTAFA